MSSNRIGSVPKQQQRTIDNQQTQQTETPEIEVFASDNVSAKVNLTTDDTNSLFNRTNYFEGLDLSTSNSSDDELKLTDLPDEIIEKYPSAKEQEALKKLTPEQFEQAKKLFDTKLPAVNIAQIAIKFTPEQIDTIKTRINELEEQSGGKDNVYQMVLTNDSYETDTYNLMALTNDLKVQSDILDEELNTRSIESLQEFTTEDGRKYRIREAYDLKNNTLSKIRYDQDPKTNISSATYEIRSKIKPDGTMISRELTKPSAVSGMFDVEVLTEDGKKQVSTTTVSKKGKTVIRRDMESPDGTRTEYSYKEDAEGNRYSKYKITTPEGEVLMNNTKSFKVVNENTFKSTTNGKSYTMKIENNILTVTNDKDPNETAQIDLGTITGNKEALIKSLKQMSGDQLIALSKTTNGLVGIDNVLESYYKPSDKTIHSGEDMFVVLHEEGHAKDFQTLDTTNMFTRMLSEETLLSRNPELKETFEAEKESFFAAFPDSQREHVDYFVNTLTHYSGPDGGLQETTAETNALLETPRSNPLLGLRTQYLQQYFPRTIAMLNTELSQDRAKYSIDTSDAKIPGLSIPEIKIPIPKIPTPKTP